MYFIDYMFLGFAFISLYVVALFIILFVKNKTCMFKDAEVPEDLPTVSLIIPAYNEEDNIKATLDAIKQLRYPPELLEIIVVDDGSADRTVSIAKDAGVRVITQANAGKAAALNNALRYAKGEIVGCVDADSYPERDALLCMVPYFKDNSFGAVTSSIFVRNAKNFLEKLQEMEYILIAWNRKLLDYLNSVYVTPGPLSLYRKDLIVELGGFDETILTEDIEIGWRLQKAGYKIGMALGAKVYTKVPSSLRIWWNQRLRWDIGGIQTVFAYRACFRRSYGIFGMFIIPYFSFSMILSLFGLALFIYLVILRITTIMDFWHYAVIAGINPLRSLSVNLLPNVFTVLGLLIFFVSLLYLIVGLTSMDKKILNFRTFFDMVMYLSVYLFMFPILLVQSFWRLAVYKKQKW